MLERAGCLYLAIFGKPWAPAGCKPDALMVSHCKLILPKFMAQHSSWETAASWLRQIRQRWPGIGSIDPTAGTKRVALFLRGTWSTWIVCGWLWVYSYYHSCCFIKGRRSRFGSVLVHSSLLSCWTRSWTFVPTRKALGSPRGGFVELTCRPSCVAPW